MQLLARETTRRFLYGFWAVRQRMFRHAGPVLEARHGLEMRDFFLLDHIAGSDLSPTEIAAELELPAHVISRHLDAIEQAGLIRRTPDPDDARRRRLSLTPAGRERLDQAASTLTHEIESFLGVLTDAELAAFLTTLESLAKERTA